MQVIVAGNGLAAVEQLKRSVFDAVLMDCQMPVMDGYEATAQIRSGAAGEASRHVPIIAMTANALTGDKERCLIAGMDDYVSKPIATDLLQSVLERSFARGARLQSASQVQRDAGAEASATSIWDVDRLVAMIGDDPAFLSELVTVFLDTMATQVQLLATAPSRRRTS
jgi:two-component system sensor histidine kinase/response regulator